MEALAVIDIAEAYRTRPIRFLDYWRLDDWTLKVYGIAYAGLALGAALIEAAEGVARQRLTQSADECNHYHLGFVGIHQGRTGNLVFVDWWADENELHHHAYFSPSEAPANLEYRTPTGLAACAWDLHLISHERDAWLRAVLKNRASPDPHAYLADCFNGDV
jgi:hypothetical protein